MPPYTNKVIDSETNLEGIFNDIEFLANDQTVLFNAGTGTNFIYKVSTLNNIDIDEFNRETYKKRDKLTKRLIKLCDLNCELEFVGIESDNFFRNLFLVDSDLPRIVSEALLARYINKESSLNEITSIMEKENPLDYPVDSERSYYQYKIKRMLRDMAMGMTAETPWNGDIDANGGTLVVRDDGEVVCYHIYDVQKYENYLFNHTYFETPSTGEDEDNPGHKKPNASKKYFYGWLYEEDGNLFIKLNLQIRYSS